MKLIQLVSLIAMLCVPSVFMVGSLNTPNGHVDYSENGANWQEGECATGKVILSLFPIPAIKALNYEVYTLY